MELKEIMSLNNFVVVGDTFNPEKYAYKIKHELLDNGYNVECVYKELKSINDVSFDIDCLVLCINSFKGLELVKELKKDVKSIVIQPGAESTELLNYLKDNGYDYLEGCVLVGIRLYKKN